MLDSLYLDPSNDLFNPLYKKSTFNRLIFFHMVQLLIELSSMLLDESVINFSLVGLILNDLLHIRAW